VFLLFHAMNKKAFGYILLIAAISAAGGYLYWYNFLRYDSAAESVKQYQEAEKRYIEAMTADTYGGKTPQETLDMFVDALRKGDIDLASKYFLLDENLSREKWVRYLEGVRSKNLLVQMADDFSSYKFYKSLYDGNQQFVIRNNDNTDNLIIDLRFNKYSKAWKIESL